MPTSWCCAAHSHVVLLYLTGILKEGQVIHASSYRPGSQICGYKWRDSTDFDMIRVTSRWWSRSSFVLPDLVSAVVHTTAYSGSLWNWWTRLLYFWVDIIQHWCNKVGEFLHFVLSFSIDLCGWLRSGSLVVFTVSTSWGGRMPHGSYAQGLSCKMGFLWLNSWS